MKRTQIQLTNEQINWLKVEAAKEGVSMAHLIRDSIDHYRARTKKGRVLGRNKESALSIVGSFSSSR